MQALYLLKIVDSHIYGQMKLKVITGACQNVIPWKKSFIIIVIFVICFCCYLL